MKIFPLFAILLISLTGLNLKLSAQNLSRQVYYVKATGSDGDGLSDATAWNFAKLNATSIPSGSTILLKKGDTLYGELKANLEANNDTITFGAYGMGDDPLISGFSTLTSASWTLHSGSIYWATVDVPELNVVMLDGSLKAMGRYPKTGYITYTGHSGNISITSSTAIPFDPVGAEVVIRKIRQIMDRHVVTSYADNTISLASRGDYNTVFLNNSSYQPTDGNGFFIQGSLSTLTNLGDWYYDKVSKRLYMHFASDVPSCHTVRVSTIPVLCQINNKVNLKFQNITFEGANRELIRSNTSSNIKLLNCGFRYGFNFLLADNGMTDFVLQGGYIKSMLNNGVFIPQLGNNVMVSNVNIENIGIIPGAGGSGDAMQLGIWIQGNNITVRKCNITNIGYHGIVLYGNNTLCERNYINTYGLVKDDCGAIYEFQLPGVTHINKVICNNIILNGIGVPAGAPWYEQYGQAAAIYLDANVTNVNVRDNVLANGSWGGVLLIGVGINNMIVRNLTYNFSKGLLIYNFKDQPIRKTTITDNKWIARTTEQYTLGLQMYADDDPTLYGAFDRNIYARPVNDNSSMSINREYIGGGGSKTFSLAMWQSIYSQDLNSSKSKVTTDQISDLRFDYNNTDQALSIPLDSLYTDVSNTSFTSSVNLLAYTGSLLVKMKPRGNYHLKYNKTPIRSRQAVDSTSKALIKSSFNLPRSTFPSSYKPWEEQNYTGVNKKDTMKVNILVVDIPTTSFDVMQRRSDLAAKTTPILKSDMLQEKLSNNNEGRHNLVVSNNTSEGQSSSSSLLWQTAGNNIRNVNSGAVIIGQKVVHAPVGYQLYVTGGILTEKVKVALLNTNDWSDKVFGPAYRLRTLSQVERYIHTNQHLPGIPSASTVIQQGIDVVQMNAKLLEKVEELTLYLIAQRKELISIHKQVHQLKQSVQRYQKKK